jgi:uncharacterized protein YggE
MRYKEALFFLLALMFAGLALADAQAVSPARTVTVAGEGEVNVLPDKAIVSMGAQATEPKLAAAREKVAQAVRSFLDLTRELAIDDKHVQTSQLTVRPEYQWNPETGEQRMIGYFVERQLTVDLRNLEQLGVLMERAVSLGVNVVSGPQFGSSREDELRREALQRAATNARANAQALAESLGAKLGPLRKISAASLDVEPPPVPYAMAKMEAADASAADTYQTGQINFTSQVTAQFDLIVQRQR